MDPLEKIERKRQARHRIRAQRERASRLKTRVVATSLICFALLWGIVFAQMATGNDPVLGNASKPAGRRGGGNTQAAKAPAEAPREEAFEREEEEVAEEEAEAVEVEPVEEEPAPVTTSQS